MMKLLFLGDFIYDYCSINNDIEKIAEYIKNEKLFTIINLEAPVKSSTPIKKWINLYNTDIVFNILKRLNTVAVNLANNHIYDWGKDGLENLINKLEQCNIKFFGAGIDRKTSLSPCYIGESNDIAILGFGWEEEMCVSSGVNKPGVAPLKNDIVLDCISAARENSDIIIANLHWGYEYELYPLPIHRQLSFDIIKNGADLIIGHHPHIIQAYEIHEQRHIYYSLGNFYFGSRRKNFENKRNGKLANRGLGIIYDTTKRTVEHLFFEFKENESVIVDKFHLTDISHVSLQEYNEFFTINRITNEKPNLYIGKREKLNSAKLAIYHIKKKAIQFPIKFAVKLLKKSNYYVTMRDYYRRWIRSVNK